MEASIMRGASDSIEQFVLETRERRTPGARFESESARLLRVDVDGGVWLKPGAAIAYRGDVSFERLPSLGARSLPDAAAREVTPLVRAFGSGRLYCGHHGWHVHRIRLEGDTIFVAWDELLAFEASLRFETALVGHGLTVAAGGRVAVRLSGHGSLALALHGSPLTLPVTPGDPVSTDPHATIAWSAQLAPTLKTDITWRSLLGHGGQEPVQMLFEGTGFVVVQPFKDPVKAPAPLSVLKRLRSVFTG